MSDQSILNPEAPQLETSQPKPTVYFTKPCKSCGCQEKGRSGHYCVKCFDIIIENRPRIARERRLAAMLKKAEKGDIRILSVTSAGWKVKTSTRNVACISCGKLKDRVGHFCMACLVERVLATANKKCLRIQQLQVPVTEKAE